jgi:hypothetical protein
MDGLTVFAAAKAAEMTYLRTTVRGTTLRRMYELYESQSIFGALKNLFRLRGDRVAIVSGCSDTFQGYGFDTKCSDASRIAWKSSQDSELVRMYQGEDNKIRSAVPSFNSSAALPDESNGEWSQVTNLFKSEPVCGRYVPVSKCSLHNAIVEYNIVFRSKVLSLKNQSWQDDNDLSQTVYQSRNPTYLRPTASTHPSSAHKQADLPPQTDLTPCPCGDYSLHTYHSSSQPDKSPSSAIYHWCNGKSHAERCRRWGNGHSPSRLL